MQYFVLPFIVALVSPFATSCKQRNPASDVLGEVKPAIEKVPARGYHFGQFKHLSKYGDRAGTFTTEEWEGIPSIFGQSQSSTKSALSSCC